MNRLKYFAINLECACKKLNIQCPQIDQDNRMGQYMASTTVWIWKDTRKEFYVIKYNLKVIAGARKIDILAMIFHELGHIALGHLKERKKTLDQMEYEAEKFSIENIEKYYPEYYLNALNTLKTFKNIEHPQYKKFYNLWKEKTNNE